VSARAGCDPRRVARRGSLVPGWSGNGRSGITLLELLVALLVSGFVLLAVAGLFRVVVETLIYHRTTVSLVNQANVAVFGSGPAPGLLRDLRRAVRIDTPLLALSPGSLCLAVRGEDRPIRYQLRDGRLFRQRIIFDTVAGAILGSEDQVVARDVRAFAVSCMDSSPSGRLVPSAGTEATVLVDVRLDLARGRHAFRLATSGSFRL